jgi:hypothetical protein
MTWPMQEGELYIPNVENLYDFNIQLDEDSMEAKLQDLIERSLPTQKYKLIKLVATVEIKFDDQSMG